MTTERTVAMSRKYYDEYSAAAYAKKVTQETADYNPLGGTDTEACVNCQFFISPDHCSVVESFPMPISPTGHSRFWTAVEKYEMEPMRVVIVEEEEEEEEGMGERASRWQSIKDAAASFFGLAPLSVAPASHDAVVTSIALDVKEDRRAGFKVFQDAMGDTRWLAWVSNNFKDREGEIFEDAAHREFVEFLDNGGQMPEAWLWHTPGTRWGQADFADYDDGFLVMSGVVDGNAEAQRVAKSLADEQETLGVSHGFYFRYSNDDPTAISWYRSFEISPLPLVAAANAWTGIQVIREGKEMNAAKQEWLESKLGKERTAQLIADRSDISKALTEMGVDSKGMPADDAVIVNTSELATAAVKAITDSAAFASLTEGVTAIKANGDALAARIDALEVRMKGLEISDDEKVAAALTGKRATNAGYRASQETDTALADSKLDAALKAAVPVQMVDPGFAKSLY